MSQLRKFPEAEPSDNERARLRLVDGVEFEPHAPSNPHPDSGVAWARAYQTRLLISDAAIIVVTMIAAVFTRAVVDSTPGFISELPPIVWLGLGAIALVWILVLEAFHTRDWRIIGSGPNEYKRVITACMTAFGLLSVTVLVIEVGFPGKATVVTMALGVVGLLVSRWAWRRWLTTQRRYGHALSRVVVVGTRSEIDYVVSRIKGNLSTAFKLVGVLTDPEISAPRTAGAPHPYSFTPEEVVEAAADLGADAVIVAGDHGFGNDFIRNLAWRLEGTAAELILASCLANVAGPRIHFRPVEGLPLIHVEIPQFDGGKHVVKRGLDIAVSAIALIVLAPLFLLLALIIRAESPGGAFYSQVRVGRDLETFRMFKFRSMVSDADAKLAELQTENEGSGVLFKLKNDPRVTRVGRFIRKYSLDELPQIWNVLKGDMSLVGPRPPLPSEVRAYKGKVNRRLYIKPGLTGMWQINGRSDLNWEDSMRLDLYYVENWSVVGDLVIMWRTFKVLVKPVGAY
ncbi:sugar transferase [Salinibacterium sp. SWN248]|uniref:sugar transferase n=1 Tax=Salinibacterium sp. SWN248 TaxID=2792056 RepID=UPI0018CCBB16|nr:sugar transferase [Salinibacterium sp. SWN248]MBH0022843.1 sugar transferase [Salinibacterium sp. SWN248]